MGLLIIQYNFVDNFSNSVQLQNRVNEIGPIGYKVNKNKVNHDEVIEIEIQRLCWSHMKDKSLVLF